jgi:hypothetical protein
MSYLAEQEKKDNSIEFVLKSQINALRLLEGRWKLVILFHLFGGKVLRFSELEEAIPAITQKMLGQQLRRMEADGIVGEPFIRRCRQRSSKGSQHVASYEYLSFWKRFGTQLPSGFRDFVWINPVAAR